MVGGRYYSQHGEDEALSKRFPGSRGVFVEVGAADGVEGSNTLHFEERGWEGLLVEANPYLAASCRAVRRAPVAQVAVSSPGAPAEVEFQVVRDIPQLSGITPDRETLRIYGAHDLEAVSVACRTLDDVLEEYLPGRTLDFVTIDVEGHEWEVLSGFSLDRWKPSVVIVERNYQPDWRVFRRMHRCGYAYTGTTVVNDWFELGVPQSTVQLLRAVAPEYRRGMRPVLKNALDRARLLGVAQRLKRSLTGG